MPSAEQHVRRPRLASVFHVGDIGGPAKTLAPRLRALAERWDVEIVAPRAGSLLKLFDGFDRTILPYEALTSPATAAETLRAVAGPVREAAAFSRHFRRTRPDVVLVVTSMLPAALIGARLAGCRAIVYAGELVPGRRAAARPLVLLTRALANAIACNSQFVARQFRDSSGDSSVVVIPPGIDPTMRSGDGQRFRRAHGIPREALCLCIVGNVSPGRGQDVAIQALTRIVDEVPGSYCVIAGEPHRRPRDVAYRRTLLELSERLGLAARVKFVGFVEGVADVYAAADVVVNPARVEEGFGRVACEGLAAERPVVASRVGAIPEILRDGEDALLVTPDDADELAAAVLQLWTEPSLRARIVASGRNRVLAHCDEAAGVAAFSRLVESTLPPRP